MPSIDIAKGEVWLPVGALTVTTPAFSEAVNPTKERVEGAVAVPPSRDTFKGASVQLISLLPLIWILLPGR